MSGYKKELHPAIKLISLIIVSIFVTQGGWSTLLIMGVFMLPFYCVHFNLWHSALKMLVKLKWFFFSILLIYFFFTPDIAVEQNQFLSLWYQLLPGFFRITVLLVILFAVNLFIQTTPKEQILAALLWLFDPLQKLHIDIERLALRAVLTLEYIEYLTVKISDFKNRNKPSMATSKEGLSKSFSQKLREKFQQKKAVFYHLISQSGIILHDVLLEANNTSGKHYEIDYLPAPMLVQYLFPIVIFLVLLLTL